MKISQLAKLTGMSTHTLRYYEKSGLITSIKRSGNNYRAYSKDDVATALFIKRCKQSGFSLAETAKLIVIKNAKDAHTCEEAKSIAHQKVVDITHQIQQLVGLKSILAELADTCCGGNESAKFCSIIAKLENDTTQLQKDPNYIKRHDLSHPKNERA
ncbi:MAG: MerR family Zn(II)-responsive transcriptional regulator of zntA [Alphaproteobacteria bacterium]|jgi:MerR family Zn(II)-responsive transcriptional regulator of zntA